jgi:ATP-dependent helicase/nuclease subunit A
MAEQRMQWTEQQKRAIDARGSDVLVTASAGTGKTAVLSGRCVSIVSDRAICPDVRNVLVLTFTEAAAEQMRSRIAERLREAFLEKRDDHLRRQVILLQAADISTIHSFCKRLITEHFYRLDLDPTFRVIDGDEQRLLKSEVLEKNIDRAWQQDDIRAALKELLYRRDLWTSDGFLRKIIEISDFLDGVISREDWYERAARLAQASHSLTSGLGNKQKHIVAGRLQSILSQLHHVRTLYESEGGDSGWDDKLRKSHVEPVEQCAERLKAGDWDKCAEAIRNYSKPTTYKPKSIEEPVANLIRNVAKGAVDSFTELSHLAIINPDYLERLGDSVELQTMVLIELVRQYDELYRQAKRAVNCLDFADLEHYALRLLTDKDVPEDEPTPSQTALALRQRYRHIFVDEYQDINAVQQRIIQMLAPGGSVLGVGDSKQSIYAFRGAQPDIFLDRVKLASLDSGSLSSGLRVDLNVNFRSAKGILDFVNAIFSRIMTASFSKIDYDESAMLNPGLAEESQARASNEKGSIVEFHILDEEKAEAEDTQEDTQNGTSLVTARRRQAAMIARRIKTMVGADAGKAEFQIVDKQQGCRRDVDYRDIVVLMRSLAKKANDYVEIFRLAGVPVSCQATAGYFEATEISDMLCLLKVLDNPQRDIELAAVLRSPFFKISDTELARIKIHKQSVPPPMSYFDRALRYSRSGSGELAGKLTTILERIECWRTRARRGNIADLIWHIYRETGLLSFVSALPNGQARRANLLKLHDRAIQFEGFASSAGLPSLRRFVDFIEKLQATGQDWAPAEPQGSVGNAVRILSVHKSKGLEFPVVFLAELDSAFNLKDVQADCLSDAEDTLGLQVIDRPSNSKINSLAHEVIAEHKRATALAEELRILYVASTRAKDRLVLTASGKRGTCRQMIQKAFFLGAGPVPDWQLSACRSPLEWILYALSNQKALHDVFETGLADRVMNGDLFEIRLHTESDLKHLSEFVIGLKSGKSTRPSNGLASSPPRRKQSNLLKRVKKSLSWRYRFSEASCLPAKSSVTQLTHIHDEYIQFDYSRALERRPRAAMAVEPDIGTPVEARLIGTAAHLVISELDLTRPVTGDEIERTRDRLVADKRITAIVAEQINTESILAFFESELGRLALDPSNSVWREWPFTFALPASEWEGLSPARETRCEIRDTIIVQGMIDLLIKTVRGLVIVDFKTDRITTEQATERAELYRRQLALYSKAASAILRYETIARWLYFLAPCCSVEV